MTIIKDFISLIFPNTCVGCGNELLNGEETICTVCQYQLPKTNFHLEKDNPVAKIFWGRVPVEAATSYYSYSKGTKVQELIHQFKYKGQKQVGVTIGKWMGTELKGSEFFNDIDVIIPVPIHRNKIRKRGYNQSEYFARGLSQSLNVETDFKTLYRAVESETQTRKSRFNRWKNVEDIFQLRDNVGLTGKRILIVDDVVTTGSTLEACIQTLRKIAKVEIAVVTIASSTH